jgi:hypothetical protein
VQRTNRGKEKMPGPDQGFLRIELGLYSLSEMRPLPKPDLQLLVGGTRNMTVS